MTINDIRFKLKEFSAEELAQLENSIQAEKQHRENIRRSEICSKIIEGLELFAREFPYESIVINRSSECNNVAIYPEEIISHIKDEWLR